MKDNVKFAEKYSQLTNIQKLELAPESVERFSGRRVKVSSVSYVGREDVFNMEVKNHHNFAVNGGFIVHNCIDATRYAFADDMRNVKVTIAPKVQFGFI